MVVLLTGDDDGAEAVADAQTVRFQKPTDDGPDPFTKRADVRGDDHVDVGSGPFGGTGSDLVCDRELLIRSLRARPDRLREWARVLDVRPTAAAVARYIRRLRPVTLTRDTRVTNHSFVDGHAVAFQAILQAGTAVLVDKDGVPVARCRCGNPLLKPIYIETAKCFGCPAHYRPPPPCKYLDYDDSDYARYDDDEFIDLIDVSRYENTCYLPYPDPPAVRRRRGRAPPTTQAANPAASFSPSSGTVDDTYTLFVSGFAANRTLSVTLTRPDGVAERFSITTGSGGSGSRTFPRVDNRLTGTYTATIVDSGSGDRASASTTVRGAQQQSDDGGLQCNPPRSQLESEKCAARDEQTQPDPDYDCPDQPPAHPGEDYLRNCPSQ
jgi:hypothetical protein